MSARAALLAVSSAAGLLLARALDGFGLLPGVAESEELRRAATDPRLTAVGLALCALLGVSAARLLERSPRAAMSVLVIGQQAVVVALEELGRELSGLPEPPSGETGLWVAALLQLPLVALAVTTALLVLRLVLPVAPPRVPLPTLRPLLPAYRLVLVREVPGGERGRAPPRAA